MKRYLTSLALCGALSYTLPVYSAGVDYLVAKCNPVTKKCETPVHVIDKWPMLKGTPFAGAINGAIDAVGGEVTLYSGSNIADFVPSTGQFMFFSNDAFADAPDFLHQGADVMFDMPKTTALPYGAVIYIKNDTAVFYHADWKAPQKTTGAFPGINGTLFAKKIDAAMPVPFTDKEQTYLFSGGYFAVLNAKTGQLVGTPQKISDAWSGLPADYHGVKGGFISDNIIYLFIYKPQSGIVTPQ